MSDPLRWTTEPPTKTGFYWAEEPGGYVTMVHYYGGAASLFLQMGCAFETLDARAWVRFSDRPIALPEAPNVG
jgi:hypothetical protein